MNYLGFKASDTFFKESLGMNFKQIKTFGSVMFSGLLLGGIGIAPLVANASPRAEQGTLISFHERVDKTFVCDGGVTVDIEENASGYSYRATTLRGGELVIDGGTAHTGRNYSIIYVFYFEGAEYVLEDYGNGTADLTTGTYPAEKATFRCQE